MPTKPGHMAASYLEKYFTDHEVGLVKASNLFAILLGQGIFVVAGGSDSLRESEK